MPIILNRESRNTYDLVLISSVAHVSGNARLYGRYNRLAVMKVAHGFSPGKIDARSHNVKKILCETRGLFTGKTSKCQYGRKLKEMREEYFK